MNVSIANHLILEELEFVLRSFGLFICSDVALCQKSFYLSMNL